jgi:TatD family-associated radical SAM protein
VRINTDGLANLVHRRNVLPELATCVDALSVSMNAQDEQVYAQHCLPALPGSFEAMLDFLTLAPRYIADVSATAIAGLEGVDIAACEAIATRLGVKFRRRELDVVG